MTPELLLEITLKSSAVLLLAWLATRLMSRSSAAARHLVWTAAFLAVLLLPLMIAIGPNWTVATMPARATAGYPHRPPVLPATSEVTRLPAIQPNGEAGAIVPTLAPADFRSRFSGLHIKTGIVDVAFAGAVLILLKLLLGLIWAARLRRQATRIAGDGWAKCIADACRALGMKRLVPVLQSARTSIACTSGILRPRILVPLEAQHWDAVRRRAVLLHELGHVKRQDCLFQTLARTASGLYWFNPLIHFAAAKMFAEQERACDDIVLNAGIPAPAYANDLLDMARAFRSNALTDSASLAITRPSKLADRLTAILDPKRNRCAPSPGWSLAVVLIASLGILPLGAAKLGMSAGSVAGPLVAPLQVSVEAVAKVILPTAGAAVPAKTGETSSRKEQKPVCASVVECQEAFATTDPDLVFVSASVLDSQDRIVTGLRAENFGVWEDKADQTIEYFSESLLPLSIGLITGNMSGKVATDLGNLVKNAGDPGQYFLVHMAPRQAFLEQDFTNDVSLLQSHVYASASPEALPLLDSVYLGLDKLKSATGRKAILLIADREDTSRYTIENVKSHAEQQDVQIFVIGVRVSSTGKANLEELVAPNSGHAFFTDSEDALPDLIQKIGLNLGNRYMLGYRSTNHLQDGLWRSIRVRVVPPSRLGRLTVRARSGYYAPRKMQGAINFMSYQKEIELGRELAAEVERQVKPADSVVNDYVKRIGQTIAQNSDVKVPFTIKTFESTEVNAFALPGGFMYVSTGLILAAATEAEFAGIISHEIAHIAARHGAEQSAKGQLVNLSMAGAQRQPQEPMIPVTFLSFSRSAEAEADYLGLQYMFKTGYDPGAMLGFFEGLASQVAARPEVINKLFTTHPPVGERVDRLRTAIEGLRAIRPAFIGISREFEDIKARLSRRG